LHKTLLGLVAMSALAVPATALADSNPNAVQTHQCGDGMHSLSLTGSQTLWPPNHKFRYYTVSANSNAVDTDVSLMSTVTANELTAGPGAGGPNHADFASPNPASASNSSGGNVSTQQGLRSERDGFGSGRVYTFNVMAAWDHGLITCSAQFTVAVPHDQRPTS